MTNMAMLMDTFSRGSIHEIEIENDMLLLIVIETAIQSRIVEGKKSSVLAVKFLDEETDKTYSLDYSIV